MIAINLHHLIRDSARRHPDRPAVSFKDMTVSYRELWARTVAVAGALRSLGVAQGARVAIYLDKRIETVTATFGTSVAGGAFVPINPVLRPRQVRFILADCEAEVLVTSRQRLDTLVEALADCPNLRHVILVDAAADGTTDVELGLDRVTLHGWAGCGEGSPEGAAPPSNRIDVDMAAILYTSGSTGSPKGVVLSHRNLLVGAQSVAEYLGNTETDVILSVLPLSFDAGFSQLTTAFAVGAEVVLLNYIAPADVVQLCDRHGVTGITCVPPVWIQIAGAKWPPAVAQHLRYFANTGGRMPRPTLDSLRSTFTSARPFLMYGLTEAFRSTYLDPDEVDRRPDSIGKAIPNAEVLVVRPDGTPCTPGEEGELIHRGALVAMGYWNDPERSAERFRPAPGPHAAWRTPEIAVWSGDTVRADDEGFIYFVGRRDEMIKTSGYRVSPTEVEEVAYDTGLVDDAVALGAPDPRLGEHIVLLVTPRSADLSSEELISAMRPSVPPYMLPGRVEIRKELPRSPNGKFDRALLVEEFR